MFIKSYIFNGLAHYNVRNRIEYLMLLLRLGKIPIRPDIGLNPINCRGIYVISIRSQSDRRAFMTKQMIEQGIDFQFVDATVGKNIKEFRNCISSRSFNYLTAGSVGCWISHFRVWQKIAACRSGCFVVLEDDVTLFDKFKINIRELLNNKIGDFDILLLATGNNYKRNKRFYINNKLFVPYQLRNGAYSYILTPKGAQKLINLIPSVQVTRGGIDSAIGVLIRNNKLVSYHLEVPLCQVNYRFGSSTKMQSK